MPVIRFRWIIYRSTRTTEREIPPPAVFLPGFETKTERGRLGIPSSLEFSIIPIRNDVGMIDHRANFGQDSKELAFPAPSSPRTPSIPGLPVRRLRKG